MAPTHPIQQIDVWTTSDDYVVALRFYHFGGSPSEIFGDKAVAKATSPKSWIRIQDERITEFSVAKFPGNITWQIYAIGLKTTKGEYLFGTAQHDRPLKPIWKDIQSGVNADVKDLKVDYYPTYNNAWLVNICVIPYIPPTPPPPHTVKGTVFSQPIGVPASNFKITFDLEGKEYVYNANIAGVKTESFSGDVKIGYNSTDDFTDSRAFSGNVGFGHFHIEIAASSKLVVVVDGDITGGPVHDLGINGTGQWSNITY